MAAQKPEPRRTSPWAYVTHSPRRSAVAAAVIVGAIIVGGGIAFGLNGIRGDGDVATAPSATPTDTDAPMPSSSSASATPTATPSPTLDASVSPAATPGVETPPPTPTEAPGPSPADENRLAGTWEALPPHPGGLARDQISSSDAIRLPDGRIAVLFAHERGDGCIWIYSPATDAWEEADAEGPTTWDCFIFTDERFIRGTDGRYYSTYRIIDVTTDPWQVTYAPWHGVEDGPDNLGMTPDGRLWTAQAWCDGACHTRMFEVDAQTGAMSEASRGPSRTNPGKVIPGPPSSTLFLADFGKAPLTYQPGSDTWIKLDHFPRQPHWERWMSLEWDRAKLTDDGWLWADASNTPAPELYVRDPDTGTWLRVETPPDLRERWRPVFIDGADGRIYAMDARQPYVFTPDRSR